MALCPVPDVHPLVRWPLQAAFRDVLRATAIVMTSPNLRIRAAASRCLLFAAIPLATILVASNADAGAILVGKTPGVCTKYTLQSAIDHANTLDGYNVIIVTDDAPSGEYRENVHVGNLKPGLRLEIRGGYRSCTEPVRSGRYTRIRGASTTAPVIHLGGDAADVSITGLHLSGGSQGLELDGPATVSLYGSEESGMLVVDNRADGVRMHYSGGGNASVRSRLNLSGSVGIHSNEGSGINAYDKALLKISGSTSITENGGHGIEIHSPAEAEIRGGGPVTALNGGYGLWIEATFPFSGFRRTLIDSPDPDRPLEISSNTRGAIFIRAPSSDVGYGVDVGGVSIRHNQGRPIHLEGSGASLEMHGRYCGGGRLPDRKCGSLSENSSASNAPLVAAIDGGRIVLDRLWIADNIASSILSTNLGTGAAASAITLTDSVVAANSVRDDLFESLNQGIVDVWNSTVLRNVGGFGFSFVGIDAALLQATNSIIDQPQVLATVEGTASTTHFNRVLAANRIGASADDDILVAQPRYSDAFARLSAASPGVDYAPPAGGVDLDGYPRDVDQATIPNVHGPRDLGAYEAVLELVFHSGFE
ncbi:hypothetical protein [Dokdonella sp.]|uniref:hypothetical protein n=1 Tax=Dokdonella sp. TaxID=2291710 RepID=UPI002F3FCD6E